MQELNIIYLPILVESVNFSLSSGFFRQSEMVVKKSNINC